MLEFIDFLHSRTAGKPLTQPEPVEIVAQLERIAANRSPGGVPTTNTGANS